jgi:3-deoxy-7-phosphoheptulonate synthase
MTSYAPKTSNVHVASIKALNPPKDYIEDLPITPQAATLISETRDAIARIVSGDDERYLVLVGPCSIHDEVAGLEYARRLSEIQKAVSDRLLIVMRVYFEKPRTTVGWKGLINDPNLNGTFQIGEGLRRARQFLLDVIELGLPTATEFLDPFTPQYLADLVAWGAIGARTTESQTHRQMASGLSMPVGFKNGTGGSLQIAVDALVAAMSPHAFLGIDMAGHAGVVNTTGNPGGHLILRGGTTGSNYDEQAVARAQDLLRNADIEPNLVIDCSHANSDKDHRNQGKVFREVLRQRVEGNDGVVGVMLESNLNAGNQSLGKDPRELKYGVSITDACVNWEETETLLMEAYGALEPSKSSVLI